MRLTERCILPPLREAGEHEGALKLLARLSAQMEGGGGCSALLVSYLCSLGRTHAPLVRRFAGWLLSREEEAFAQLACSSKHRAGSHSSPHSPPAGDQINTSILHSSTTDISKSKLLNEKVASSEDRSAKATSSNSWGHSADGGGGGAGEEEWVLPPREVVGCMREGGWDSSRVVQLLRRMRSGARGEARREVVAASLQELIRATSESEREGEVAGGGAKGGSCGSDGGKGGHGCGDGQMHMEDGGRTRIKQGAEGGGEEQAGGHADELLSLLREERYDAEWALSLLKAEGNRRSLAPALAAILSRLGR